MQALCPQCDQILSGNDINVVTDVARCLRCNEAFALSSLVQSNTSGPVVLNDPPRGTWYQAESNGFTVGARTRFSAPILLHLCASGHPFFHIFGKIAQGRLDLFDSLFMLPLLLITLLVAGLMAICGKVLVRVRDSEGVLFTGIGPFGWRRRFDPQQITSVRTYSLNNTHHFANTHIVVLGGSHKLCFVIALLTKERRDFVANILRLGLTNRN